MNVLQAEQTQPWANWFFMNNPTVPRTIAKHGAKVEDLINESFLGGIKKRERERNL